MAAGIFSQDQWLELIVPVYNEVVEDVRDLGRHKHRVGLTYGELQPSLLERLIASLQIGPNDSVVDFGSGVGTVCMYLTARTGCRSFGVEVRQVLHDMATKFLVSDAVKPIKHLVELVQGDGFELASVRNALESATTVIVNNVNFTASMNSQLLALFKNTLQPGARIVFCTDIFPRLFPTAQRPATRRVPSEAQFIDFQQSWRFTTGPDDFSWTSNKAVVTVLVVKGQRQVLHQHMLNESEEVVVINKGTESDSPISASIVSSDGSKTSLEVTPTAKVDSPAEEIFDISSDQESLFDSNASSPIASDSLDEAIIIASRSAKVSEPSREFLRVMDAALDELRALPLFVVQQAFNEYVVEHTAERLRLEPEPDIVGTNYNAFTEHINIQAEHIEYIVKTNGATKSVHINSLVMPSNRILVVFGPEVRFEDAYSIFLAGNYGDLVYLHPDAETHPLITANISRSHLSKKNYNAYYGSVETVIKEKAKQALSAYCARVLDSHGLHDAFQTMLDRKHVHLIPIDASVAFPPALYNIRKKWQRKRNRPEHIGVELLKKILASVQKRIKSDQSRLTELNILAYASEDMATDLVSILMSATFSLPKSQMVRPGTITVLRYAKVKSEPRSPTAKQGIFASVIYNTSSKSDKTLGTLDSAHLAYMTNVTELMTSSYDGGEKNQFNILHGPAATAFMAKFMDAPPLKSVSDDEFLTSDGASNDGGKPKVYTPMAYFTNYGGKPFSLIHKTRGQPISQDASQHRDAGVPIVVLGFSGAKNTGASGDRIIIDVFVPSSDPGGSAEEFNTAVEKFHITPRDNYRAKPIIANSGTVEFATHWYAPLRDATDMYTSPESRALAKEWLGFSPLQKRIVPESFFKKSPVSLLGARLLPGAFGRILNATPGFINEWQRSKYGYLIVYSNYAAEYMASIHCSGFEYEKSFVPVVQDRRSLNALNGYRKLLRLLAYDSDTAANARDALAFMHQGTVASPATLRASTAALRDDSYASVADLINGRNISLRKELQLIYAEQLLGASLRESLKDDSTDGNGLQYSHMAVFFDNSNMSLAQTLEAMQAIQLYTELFVEQYLVSEERRSLIAKQCLVISLVLTVALKSYHDYTLATSKIAGRRFTTLVDQPEYAFLFAHGITRIFPQYSIALEDEQQHRGVYFWNSRQTSANASSMHHTTSMAEVFEMSFDLRPGVDELRTISRTLTLYDDKPKESVSWLDNPFVLLPAADNNISNGDMFVMAPQELLDQVARLGTMTAIDEANDSDDLLVMPLRPGSFIESDIHSLRAFASGLYANAVRSAISKYSPDYTVSEAAFNSVGEIDNLLSALYPKDGITWPTNVRDTISTLARFLPLEVAVPLKEKLGTLGLSFETQTIPFKTWVAHKAGGHFTRRTRFSISVASSSNATTEERLILQDAPLASDGSSTIIDIVYPDNVVWAFIDAYAHAKYNGRDNSFWTSMPRTRNNLLTHPRVVAFIMQELEARGQTIQLSILEEVAHLSKTGAPTLSSPVTPMGPTSMQYSTPSPLARSIGARSMSPSGSQSDLYDSDSPGSIVFMDTVESGSDMDGSPLTPPSRILGVVRRFGDSGGPRYSDESDGAVEAKRRRMDSPSPSPPFLAQFSNEFMAQQSRITQSLADLDSTILEARVGLGRLDLIYSDEENDINQYIDEKAENTGSLPKELGDITESEAIFLGNNEISRTHRGFGVNTDSGVASLQTTQIPSIGATQGIVSNSSVEQSDSRLVAQVLSPLCAVDELPIRAHASMTYVPPQISLGSSNEARPTKPVPMIQCLPTPESSPPPGIELTPVCSFELYPPRQAWDSQEDPIESFSQPSVQVEMEEASVELQTPRRRLDTEFITPDRLMEEAMDRSYSNTTAPSLEDAIVNTLVSASAPSNTTTMKRIVPTPDTQNTATQNSDMDVSPEIQAILDQTRDEYEGVGSRDIISELLSATDPYADDSDTSDSQESPDRENDMFGIERKEWLEPMAKHTFAWLSRRYKDNPGSPGTPLHSASRRFMDVLATNANVMKTTNITLDELNKAALVSPSQLSPATREKIAEQYRNMARFIYDDSINAHQLKTFLQVASQLPPLHRILVTLSASIRLYTPKALARANAFEFDQDSRRIVYEAVSGVRSILKDMNLEGQEKRTRAKAMRALKELLDKSSEEKSHDVSEASESVKNFYSMGELLIGFRDYARVFLRERAKLRLEQLHDTLRSKYQTASGNVGDYGKNSEAVQEIVALTDVFWQKTQMELDMFMVQIDSAITRFQMLKQRALEHVINDKINSRLRPFIHGTTNDDSSSVSDSESSDDDNFEQERMRIRSGTKLLELMNEVRALLYEKSQMYEAFASITHVRHMALLAKIRAARTLSSVRLNAFLKLCFALGDQSNAPRGEDVADGVYFSDAWVKASERLEEGIANFVASRKEAGLGSPPNLKDMRPTLPQEAIDTFERFSWADVERALKQNTYRAVPAMSSDEWDAIPASQAVISEDPDKFGNIVPFFQEPFAVINHSRSALSAYQAMKLQEEVAIEQIETETVTELSVDDLLSPAVERSQQLIAMETELAEAEESLELVEADNKVYQEALDALAKATPEMALLDMYFVARRILVQFLARNASLDNAYMLPDFAVPAGTPMRAAEYANLLSHGDFLESVASQMTKTWPGPTKDFAGRFIETEGYINQTLQRNFAMRLYITSLITPISASKKTHSVLTKLKFTDFEIDALRTATSRKALIKISREALDASDRALADRFVQTINVGHVHSTFAVLGKATMPEYNEVSKLVDVMTAQSMRPLFDKQSDDSWTPFDVITTKTNLIHFVVAYAIYTRNREMLQAAVVSASIDGRTRMPIATENVSLDPPRPNFGSFTTDGSMQHAPRIEQLAFTTFRLVLFHARQTQEALVRVKTLKANFGSKTRSLLLGASKYDKVSFGWMKAMVALYDAGAANDAQIGSLVSPEEAKVRSLLSKQLRSNLEKSLPKKGVVTKRNIQDRIHATTLRQLFTEQAIKASAVSRSASIIGELAQTLNENNYESILGVLKMTMQNKTPISESQIRLAKLRIDQHALDNRSFYSLARSLPTDPEAARVIIGNALEQQMRKYASLQFIGHVASVATLYTRVLKDNIDANEQYMNWVKMPLIQYMFGASSQDIASISKSLINPDQWDSDFEAGRSWLFYVPSKSSAPLYRNITEMLLTLLCDASSHAEGTADLYMDQTMQDIHMSVTPAALHDSMRYHSEVMAEIERRSSSVYDNAISSAWLYIERVVFGNSDNGIGRTTLDNARLSGTVATDIVAKVRSLLKNYALATKRVMFSTGILTVVVPQLVASTVSFIRSDVTGEPRRSMHPSELMDAIQNSSDYIRMPANADKESMPISDLFVGFDDKPPSNATMPIPKHNVLLTNIVHFALDMLARSHYLLALDQVAAQDDFDPIWAARSQDVSMALRDEVGDLAGSSVKQYLINQFDTANVNNTPARDVSDHGGYSARAVSQKLTRMLDQIIGRRASEGGDNMSETSGLGIRDYVSAIAFRMLVGSRMSMEAGFSFRKVSRNIIRELTHTLGLGANLGSSTASVVAYAMDDSAYENISNQVRPPTTTTSLAGLSQTPPQTTTNVSDNDDSRSETLTSDQFSGNTLGNLNALVTRIDDQTMYGAPDLVSTMMSPLNSFSNDSDGSLSGSQTTMLTSLDQEMDPLCSQPPIIDSQTGTPSHSQTAQAISLSSPLSNQMDIDIEAERSISAAMSIGNARRRNTDPAAISAESSGLGDRDTLLMFPRTTMGFVNRAFINALVSRASVKSSTFHSRLAVDQFLENAFSMETLQRGLEQDATASAKIPLLASKRGEAGARAYAAPSLLSSIKDGLFANENLEERTIVMLVGPSRESIQGTLEMLHSADVRAWTALPVVASADLPPIAASEKDNNGSDVAQYATPLNMLREAHSTQTVDQLIRVLELQNATRTSGQSASGFVVVPNAEYVRFKTSYGLDFLAIRTTTRVAKDAEIYIRPTF